MRTKRERRADETRARILDAAIERFVAGGYVATTMDSIGAAADVAVQTIYNVFGSKSAMLAAALDRAVTGTDGMPTAEFLGPQLDAAGDADAAVGVLVRFFLGTHSRTAPIYRLIREASAVDPELARLQRTIDRRRLETLELLCEGLAARRVLDRTVSARDAAASLWTLGSPHAYAFFLDEAGWSVQRYRRWLAASLARALVCETPRR